MNMSTYLQRAVKLATYYKACFEKYKHDMRKT